MNVCSVFQCARIISSSWQSVIAHKIRKVQTIKVSSYLPKTRQGQQDEQRQRAKFDQFSSTADELQPDSQLSVICAMS